MVTDQMVLTFYGNNEQVDWTIKWLESHSMVGLKFI